VNELNDIKVNLLFNPFFIRLDSLSPKVETPFTDITKAVKKLFDTHRTRHIIDTNIKYKDPITIMVREYVDMTKYLELRCVIHGRKLRCISGYKTDTRNTNRAFWCSLKKKIKAYITLIIREVDYHDFVADIGFNVNTSKLILIEINTPVYHRASCELFDKESDASLLYGDYPTDIIDLLPIMRIGFEFDGEIVDY
jgi:hypothetical protein